MFDFGKGFHQQKGNVLRFIISYCLNTYTKKEKQAQPYCTPPPYTGIKHHTFTYQVNHEDTGAGGNTAYFRQYDTPLATIRINSSEIPYSMIERRITILIYSSIYYLCFCYLKPFNLIHFFIMGRTVLDLESSYYYHASIVSKKYYRWVCKQYSKYCGTCTNGG